MPKPGIDAPEGRAIAARPSVRLLLGLLTAVGVLIAAPTAQGVTPTPALTFTDPASPSTDLFPLVHGNSTGSDASGLRALGGAFGSGSGPEATINLYGGETESELCEGAPIGTGTAAQLDTSGIQVSVKAEAVTYISAQQVDDVEGPSGCSTKPISYEHVTELPPPEEEEVEPPAEEPPAETPVVTPPPVQNDPIDSAAPAAPRLRTIPGGWANDNTPIVTGKAPGAASVKIYADAACQGPVVGRGSAAEFAAGLTIQVADNVVAIFTGKSFANGKASSCSAPVYYVEDSLRPRTRITFGPAFKTRRRKVVFRFTDTRGSAPGTIFRCKVDRRKWRRCKSPLRLKHLRPRRHVVRIKAIDPAGNRERRAVKRRFKVIRRR